ncbi:RNA 2'-phosphotransferase [Stackebrandtia nassauensis]
MNPHGMKRISKKLSYVLRHDPASIGVTVDAAGWIDIDTLLAALTRHGTTVSRQQLDAVVATNDKQRFTIDAERIRANQGHSITVDLGLKARVPPARLFHGTATTRLASILDTGLRRGTRHHVHLSTDTATAAKVGSRHGIPAVLTIDAAGMHDHGHEFFVSANGVWLVDSVPATYLTAQ